MLIVPPVKPGSSLFSRERVGAFELPIVKHRPTSLAGDSNPRQDARSRQLQSSVCFRGLYAGWPLNCRVCFGFVPCSLRLVIVVSSCSSFASLKFYFRVCGATGCKGRVGGHTPTRLSPANRAKVFGERPGTVVALWPKGRGPCPANRSHNCARPIRAGM